jgi:LPS-assembly lipoprotein
MLTNRRVLLALLLIMLTSLSACGFRLRGEADTALPFKTMYLRFPPGSTLGIELTRYIRASGHTTVVSDPKEADAIFEVVQPEKQERVIVAFSAGQPVEYRLYYKFAFRLRGSKDQELLPSTTFVLYRDVTFSAAQALAKEAEDQTRYKEMQSDLVQQIMRRMAAITLPQ